MAERTIVIVGMTGSIGTQALEVIDKIKNFRIIAGTYHTNVESAQKLAKKYNVPKLICTAEGYEELESFLEREKPDVTLVCIPGFVSLPITLKALETSRRVLLASKEALVCGGWLVRQTKEKTSCELIPLDSEHSAVMQLYEPSIEKVLLTSSGGALRDWKLEELDRAKPSDVLKHPVWKMGKRITVDSATMVNKGFEVLEACELFQLGASQIEVLIHREGLVHAAVFLRDGTIKMHLGFPDMRVPIAYGLTYPERLYQQESWPDLRQTQLKFEQVDRNRYPAFYLAYEIEKDYAKRTAYNAADEVCVDAFLEGRIKFTDIAKIIERVIEKVEGNVRDLSDLKDVDEASRRIAEEVIEWLSCTF
ncbi:1-deoxy-D-xylulose-5-phosphate reductoisomerase [Thermotoga caldifontis]|uniref:1-deoxy-D-xylulose-5-phosphate reductoisomerase n=1 Tax=Thermotoga caldifontis TaxID=1508419 RepID=UPI000596E5CC|nr:1-deoxy-D-xylulose-5-phosphate reductoisomerase [Thermotoga caldifontis]